MAETYVEINLSALSHNARVLTEKYNDYDYLIGVVKADAYGHGYEAAKALHRGGVGYFAVSSMEEAARFREVLPDVPLLMLQPIELERLNEAYEMKLTLAIGDREYLHRFIVLSKNYYFKVHLQVDTGFNRLGFKDRSELGAAFDALTAAGHTVEGVYQHFATAGIFDPHFDEQVRRFSELVSALDLKKIEMVHMGSGVSLLGHEKIPLANCARMGMVMYGYNVSPSSYGGGLKNRLRTLRDRYFQKKYRLSPIIRDVELDLIPAMTLKSRVIALKKVRKGEYVGYDCLYRADEDITVAVLPVGYNNGIGQKNLGRMVEIGGRLYPVIGAVGMNMSIVKVDETVKVYDEAILLGGRITLGMFSRSADMTLAEALLSVGKNNERIYIDSEGEKIWR